MNGRHAVITSAVVALLVFGNAYRNRWALDDHALVAGNPAAQSVPAALSGFWHPYWPPDHDTGVSAGLFRPLTVLSYAIDWTISGGSPAWFHVSNVLWHALATVLVVAVALRWLAPPGAMVAGVFFAVHPIHVEAVANVVGRAEIMSAVGILVAVLAARRYREVVTGRGAGWLVVALGAVLFAQLSKENGVVAIAILALDHLLEERGSRRARLSLYLWVGFVSVAWFYVWRSVAGGAVGMTIAPGIRWLTAAERIATVLPIQFDVVRLLVWPMSLAASYDPQLVAQRTDFGVAAAAGLAMIAAVGTLGILVARRAPAVSFGILAAIISYAPTSNLFFGAGLLLGERTLYLSSIAPVLAVGWLYGRVPHESRRAATVLVGIVVVVFSVRTFTRTPFWTDMRSVVTQDLLEHPEGYRTQLRIGEAYEAVGDSGRALQYFLTARELFPADPFLADPIVTLAVAMGRSNLALDEAAHAFAVAPDHSDIMALYSRTLAATGQQDSALAVARSGFARAGSAGTARLYLELLRASDHPAWQETIAAARYDWLRGRLIASRQSLQALHGRMTEASEHPLFCWEIERTRGIMAALDPDLLEESDTAADISGLACR